MHATSRLERLFIDANYLPVSLVAKLDFAGPLMLSRADEVIE